MPQQTIAQTNIVIYLINNHKPENTFICMYNTV